MALVKCAECGNEVSDRAASCPRCGHPGPFAGAGASDSNTVVPKRAKRSDPTYRIVLILMLCAVPIVAYYSCRDDGRESPAVSINGLDPASGMVIEPINIWRDYQDRSKGIVGTVRDGDVVRMIDEYAGGVKIRTASGVVGWVGKDFIRAVRDPSTAPRPSESAKPKTVRVVFAATRYVALSPSDLYPALRRDLGADANVKRDKVEGEWLGFARFEGGHVEVFEKSGVVEQMNVFFDPAAPNRVQALQMLGLDGFRTPTREVPAAFVWESTYDGVREVWALREPMRGTAVRGVMLKIHPR